MLRFDLGERRRVAEGIEDTMVGGVEPEQFALLARLRGEGEVRSESAQIRCESVLREVGPRALVDNFAQVDRHVVRDGNRQDVVDNERALVDGERSRRALNEQATP